MAEEPYVNALEFILRMPDKRAMSNLLRIFYGAMKALIEDHGADPYLFIGNTGSEGVQPNFSINTSADLSKGFSEVALRFNYKGKLISKDKAGVLRPENHCALGVSFQQVEDELSIISPKPKKGK